MDLDDLKKVEICNNCGVLYYQEEKIYLVTQQICKRCKIIEKIKQRRIERCKSCGGIGAIVMPDKDVEDCTVCNGTGRIKNEEGITKK